MQSFSLPYKSSTAKLLSTSTAWDAPEVKQFTLSGMHIAPFAANDLTPTQEALGAGFNVIPQGTDASERVGSRVYMKDMDLNFYVASSNQAPLFVRLVFYVQHHVTMKNVADPTSTTNFSPDLAIYGILQNWDENTLESYTILYDKIITLQNDNSLAFQDQALVTANREFVSMVPQVCLTSTSNLVVTGFTEILETLTIAPDPLGGWCQSSYEAYSRVIDSNNNPANINIISERNVMTTIRPYVETISIPLNFTTVYEDNFQYGGYTALHPVSLNRIGALAICMNTSDNPEEVSLADLPRIVYNATVHYTDSS